MMFGRVRVAALVRMPTAALARVLKRIALLREYKLSIDRLATPAKISARSLVLSTALTSKSRDPSRNLLRSASDALSRPGSS
jgi:hypothetical protein